MTASDSKWVTELGDSLTVSVCHCQHFDCDYDCDSESRCRVSDSLTIDCITWWISISQSVSHTTPVGHSEWLWVWDVDSVILWVWRWVTQSVSDHADHWVTEWWELRLTESLTESLAPVTYDMSLLTLPVTQSQTRVWLDLLNLLSYLVVTNWLIGGLPRLTVTVVTAHSVTNNSQHTTVTEWVTINITPTVTLQWITH